MIIFLSNYKNESIIHKCTILIANKNLRKLIKSSIQMKKVKLSTTANHL